MDEIGSLEDIQALVRQGFKDWKRYGEVNVRADGDLLIFNYSQFAQYEARWNFFECISRGLIIDSRSGEIVARSFDKFFNWLEGGRKSDGYIVSVTEKVDGSLGVLYRVDGEYRIATRGSFTGVQAIWATQFLHAHYNLTGLPDELTLLFEIIYPENRNVVNYKEREDLTLLAARNRYTGEYLPFSPSVRALAEQYGFPLPQVYEFNQLSEIVALLSELEVDQEGYVVEFSDGLRFKFKGERYLELQKLLIGLTFNNVLNAMSTGSIQSLIAAIPDEFLGQVNQWIEEIQTTIAGVKAQVKSVFDQAPKESRKEFALWVQANHKDLSSYLFARLDNYPIEPIIYKVVDWGHKEEESE